MKEVLTGNEAAALGAKLARVQVISAYPITPQTVVVEKLSEYVANGELQAEFMKVESEHSAMSACIGAAAAGARTFTATSSQGLMLMSEMLFVASGLRLPIVMANANRSLSAPLSIWCDWQDTMAVRDSGWIQLYCENNQEILDSVIQAFKIAEQTLLPVMVCYDGYILSHTVEPVDIPEQKEVDDFLPPYSYPFMLDPGKPVTLGAVGTPPYYMEFRYMLDQALLSSKKVITDVGEDFGRRFGRRYGLLEAYRCDDADFVIVTMGSLAGAVKDVVDDLRKKGKKVGVLKLRSFRPFPSDELAEALSNVKAIGVMEKDISLGSFGALFLDVLASLSLNEVRLPAVNVICGLANRDVTSEDIVKVFDMIEDVASKRKSVKETVWLGLRKELLEGEEI
ncbi:MAG: pyruvate synthase subunit PorA [Candidatus Hadarchaeales archaeon]